MGDEPTTNAGDEPGKETPMRQIKSTKSSGLIVDLFAGGGGASTGVEAALGRTIDIAINHDPVALAAHRANHPTTRHIATDVWDVKPKDACQGRPVDVLWASPDCTHFSVAKGGKPRKQNIRSLAWVVTRWAHDVRPKIIFLENVAEFRGWGPLDSEGRPVKAKMGATFRRWKAQLEKLGYVVDHRIIDASHHGAPTRRRRLFLVARCDGQKIVWPAQTHGGMGNLPVHTAAECIDWSIACPSIFTRKKPLAKKTLARVAEGIRRFVLRNQRPFIVKVNHGNEHKTGSRCHSLDEPLTTITASSRGHAIVAPVMATIDHRGAGDNAVSRTDDPLPTITAKARNVLVAPTMVQVGYGERRGQSARVLDLQEPLGTVVAGGGKHALVAAFIASHFGGEVGIPATGPLRTITATDHHSLVTSHLATFRGTSRSHPGAASVLEPLPTISAGGTHVAEVRAFLTTYYGESIGQALNEPLGTVVSKDRFGLVMVEGTEYQIVDIGLRMLEPHELLAAQFGRFAKDYDLSAAKSKKAKVRLIGNSVCPEAAEALVKANLPRLAERKAA